MGLGLGRLELGLGFRLGLGMGLGLGTILGLARLLVQPVARRLLSAARRPLSVPRINASVRRNESSPQPAFAGTEGAQAVGSLLVLKPTPNEHKKSSAPVILSEAKDLELVS
jgi:hypothetical protein